MTGFAGRIVLAFESRRAAELAILIRKAGGEPRVVEAMRAVPAAEEERAAFRHRLVVGGFHWVIFQTGAGVREWVGASGSGEAVAAALAPLRRARLGARGPKVAAALREYALPVAAAAAEPWTWREMLAALEAATCGSGGLRGISCALQAPSHELGAALRAQGVTTEEMPSYGWAMPDDCEPLRTAVHGLLTGEIPVVLFTNAIQVTHLFQVAAALRAAPSLASCLNTILVGSIGPVTTAALLAHGVTPTVEPEHPRMGFLLHACATWSKVHGAANGFKAKSE